MSKTSLVSSLVKCGKVIRYKKLSYHRRARYTDCAHDSWNLVNYCITVQEIPLEKACSRSGSDLQCHSRSSEIGLVWFVSDLYRTIVSILHRFRDITSFTVYVTACDLENSFDFDKTVEITSQVWPAALLQTGCCHIRLPLVRNTPPPLWCGLSSNFVDCCYYCTEQSTSRCLELFVVRPSPNLVSVHKNNI